jgi:hypothetical protein
MFLDALLLVSDAQAFTAAAVSTSSIDLGNITPKRAIGTGEAVGFGFQVDVAASATTVKLEVIMATDAALTAGIIVLVEETRLAADLPAGGLLFLTIPPGEPAAGFLRYIGVRVTPAGGAATVTLTSWLTSSKLFSVAAKAYAKGYTIS